MSEFEEMQDEYKKEYHLRKGLEEKIDSLHLELDYLKNGAPKLFNEIVQLHGEESWKLIIEKYQILREEFPNTEELRKSGPFFEDAIKEHEWKTATSEDTKRAYEDYIENSESGKYLSEAKTRIEIIKKEQFLQSLKDAQDRNTVRAWRTFLDDYPDYEKKNQVERKIIQLEIDEIFSNSSTGRLPESNRTGSYGTSNSSVTVNNSTRYQLILRYSGPSVTKVSIPAYGTRTVSLSSGNYKVTASAGGLNYAGTEYLSGSYESKYYISSY